MQGCELAIFLGAALLLGGFCLWYVRRLEEQGVTDVIVGFRWPYEVGADTEALQVKIDNLRQFADTVIAGTRSAG